MRRDINKPIGRLNNTFQNGSADYLRWRIEAGTRFRPLCALICILCLVIEWELLDVFVPM